MKTNQKRKLLIPAIIVLVIAVFVLVLTFYARRNTRIMQETVNAGIQKLSGSYTVTPVDAGSYQDITMYGLMKFHTAQYRVEDLGNLSVMTTNMGMMQMVSFVLSPYEKDMPLLSMDYMYSLGSRKAYTEVYDLVLTPDSESHTEVIGKFRELQEQYAAMEDIPAEPAWYDSMLPVCMHKKTSSGDEEQVRTMFCDAIETYCDVSETMAALPAEDEPEKCAVIQQYSDGLIEKGGVSTDVFKKALGEESTKEFFDKVFFGTAQYNAE